MTSRAKGKAWTPIFKAGICCLPHVLFRALASPSTESLGPTSGVCDVSFNAYRLAQIPGNWWAGVRDWNHSVCVIACMRAGVHADVVGNLAPQPK